MDPQGTWLCPDPAQGARFVDMERRMRPVRNAVFVVMGIGAMILARNWGWQVAALYFATAALVPLVDRRIATSRHPEYWLLLLALGGIASIGGAVALSGGPRSPALPWLVVPVVAATAVFGSRGVLLNLAFAVVTAILATALPDAARLVDAPEYVIATIVLLISVGLYVHGLMRTELHHRRGSVIDPLTGLLNRTTLADRFHELCQQARVADAPVAVALLDLDHFKRINDDHGHERGDAVLRDVAYEMRKALRSFELAYRLGGEEFLVILPGLDEAAAVTLIDHVRRQISLAAPGGIAITISAGVAAGAGTSLSYESLFALADARLYEAKNAGRDCVVPRPAQAGGLRSTG